MDLGIKNAVWWWSCFLKNWLKHLLKKADNKLFKLVGPRLTFCRYVELYLTWRWAEVREDTAQSSNELDAPQTVQQDSMRDARSCRTTSTQRAGKCRGCARALDAHGRPFTPRVVSPPPPKHNTQVSSSVGCCLVEPHGVTDIYGHWYLYRQFSAYCH